MDLSYMHNNDNSIDLQPERQMNNFQPYNGENKLSLNELMLRFTLYQTSTLQDVQCQLTETTSAGKHVINIDIPKQNQAYINFKSNTMQLLAIFYI